MALQGWRSPAAPWASQGPSMPQQHPHQPQDQSSGRWAGLALFLWPGIAEGHPTCVPAQEDGDSRVTPIAGAQRVPQNTVGGGKCPRSTETSAATWLRVWHCDPSHVLPT